MVAPDMPDRLTEGPLEDRLRRALTAAMKQRDRTAVNALRSALGAIDNAEALGAEPVSSESEGPIAGARVGLGAAEADRLELSEADVAAVVRAEIAERLEAAEVYENCGQPDRAQVLHDEIAVLLGHVGES